jgi:hypothetical protein
MSTPGGGNGNVSALATLHTRTNALIVVERLGPERATSNLYT